MGACDDRYPSASYIMVAEDDFELCQHGWADMMSLFCKAKQMGKGSTPHSFKCVGS
jgi:hypothetical protein